LAVGSVIYLAWRADSLLMFAWADSVGLSGTVDALRSGLGPTGARLPAPIRFVVPDALWAYSFAAAMRILWLPVPNRRISLAWTALGPLLATCGEVGQLTSVVPGTFDWLDLLACGLSFPAALLLIRIEGQ